MNDKKTETAGGKKEDNTEAKLKAARQGADDEADFEEEDDEPAVLRPVDEDEEIDRFRGRDDREEKEPEREERREAERKRRFSNADELMGENLASRVKNANPRLRALLKGLIQVSLRGSSTAYHLDWRDDEPKVAKGAASSPDCLIQVNERDLIKIAHGELNPQIAMLSDKVKVEGRSEFAVYFFNLIAGTGRGF